MPNVPTPHEKFQHRCEARALLFQCCELELQDAVDVLWQVALDLKIDADTAQSIMAQAFAKVREP